MPAEGLDRSETWATASVRRSRLEDQTAEDRRMAEFVAGLPDAEGTFGGTW